MNRGWGKEESHWKKVHPLLSGKKPDCSLQKKVMKVAYGRKIRINGKNPSPFYNGRVLVH